MQTSLALVRCRLCRLSLQRPSLPRRRLKTGDVAGVVRVAGRVSPQDTAEFVRVYLAPYQLPQQARQHTWRGRAFWACLATGAVYGACQLWETHQARKSDPDSLSLPFAGPLPGISRWSLMGPYAAALLGSSCVFGMWRVFGLLRPGGGGGGAGVAMSARGAKAFLRLFVERPGLGASTRLTFSRPLVGPLCATLSHRYAGHFLASQLVLLGAVTGCIGKLSPGELVAFCVAAAYASSLAGVVAMSVANQFVCRLGAGGVLSALVAYNALTADETLRVWSPPPLPATSSATSAEDAASGIGDDWSNLPVLAGVAAWAAAEAAGWAHAAMWLRRPPRLNHAGRLAGLAFGAAYALGGGHRLVWSGHPVPRLRVPIRPAV